MWPFTSYSRLKINIICLRPPAMPSHLLRALRWPDYRLGPGDFRHDAQLYFRPRLISGQFHARGIRRPPILLEREGRHGHTLPKRASLAACMQGTAFRPFTPQVLFATASTPLAGLAGRQSGLYFSEMAFMLIHASPWPRVSDGAFSRMGRRSRTRRRDAYRYAGRFVLPPLAAAGRIPRPIIDAIRLRFASIYSHFIRALSYRFISEMPRWLDIIRPIYFQIHAHALS